MADLEGLTEAEVLDHFDVVKKCVKALREAYQPEGFNIGINMGRVAGAGVIDHVHTHIVPRWNGDTNFTTVVADLRVVPQALASNYKDLKSKIA